MPPALPKKAFEPELRAMSQASVQIGKYLLRDKLGSGGMAEVYRGKLIGAGTFSKDVAIKRILAEFCGDAEFKQSFEREAILSSSLTHPNIVQTFDYVASEEGYLLVMEYIKGRNLAQIQTKLKEKNHTLPPVLSAYLIGEVCKGLDYAHCKKSDDGIPLKIVHRDISPHNIMVGYDGNIKILDFGIAKTMNNGAQRTATGVLKGKLAYMAPEQASGKPVGVFTDVYAMGLVLYELLCDKRAIVAASEIEAIEVAREGNFVSPLKYNANVPLELNAIAMRALAKLPEHRYLSAAEMYSDLQNYLNENLRGAGQKEMNAFMDTLFSEEIIADLKRDSVSIPSTPFSSNPSSSGGKFQKKITGKKEKREWIDNNTNEPVTISLGWLLALLVFGLGGFALFRYRTPLNSYLKSLTVTPPPIRKEITESDEAESTSVLPSAVATGKKTENNSEEAQLLNSKGGSTTAASVKLTTKQALLHFLSTSKSESATLRILWKDANGEGGGFDGCRIHPQSICPAELIQGVPPFTLTLQPYQRTPGSVPVLFTMDSCSALRNSAKYDTVLGTCTISLLAGESKLYIYLERQN